MAFPDYYKDKLPNGFYRVFDFGQTYYQDRHGKTYNPCENCGELTPEGQLDDHENNCPKCWRDAHSCYQCGEYNEKLHSGQDGHNYCPECFIEYLEEQLQRRNGMDLNSFYTWQQQDPDMRHVQITIEHNNKPKVWVYDFTLMAGQHVKSVDEINLVGVREAREKAEYERLKAKFEEGSPCQPISPPLVTNG